MSKSWLDPLGNFIDAIMGTSSIVAAAKHPPVRVSTLERNFLRLRKELVAIEGFKIAILGQPGAGKSSLLLNITNGKVKPKPIIGIHTDATDWSKDKTINLISTAGNDVFVDAPGYNTASHPTAKFDFPFGKMNLIILVIKGKIHQSDEIIFKKIHKQCKQVFLVRTFLEMVSESDRKLIARDIQTRLNVPPSVPIHFVCNRTKEGVQDLRKRIGMYSKQTRHV